MSSADWALLGKCFAGALLLVLICGLLLRLWARRFGARMNEAAEQIRGDEGGDRR